METGRNVPVRGNPDKIFPTSCLKIPLFLGKNEARWKRGAQRRFGLVRKLQRLDQEGPKKMDPGGILALGRLKTGV